MNASVQEVPVALPAVEPIADAALQARIAHRIERKTMPRGALGRIEPLALQLGLILRSEAPVLHAPQMLVFAADHGIAAQGVSAYPRDVTVQMVENMLDGGAAISVFARRMGLALTVIDAGVAADLAPRAGLLTRRIAQGTRDASVEAAMSDAQCMQAIRAGAEVVRDAPGNVVLFGEMGIGNTSSAALLLARLARVPLADAVGRGTGLDDDGLARKRAVLARTLSRHAGATQPLQALAAFGGFEIAMMVGAMLQAAHERRVLVLDGFVVGAAALVARAIAPAIGDYCVFAHHGAEHGHAAMLASMQAQPLLALELRLGEGSGAALAWPLVDAAARMLAEMASFESAGVSDGVRSCIRAGGPPPQGATCANARPDPAHVHELRLLGIALQFLTRVPVRIGRFEPSWLADSARHFPLVGVLVGIFGAAVLWSATTLWPLPLAVMLSMAATAWLTGGFHEDGLADTCDGLGGAVGREKALEIMKDSRLGTYGALGLLFVLGLKACALWALASESVALVAVALVLAHGVSRAGAVAVLALLPYGGDPGHAKALPMTRRGGASLAGTAFAWTAAFAVAAWLAMPDGLGAARIAFALGCTASTVLGCAAWLRSRLGGHTGDALGAVQQLGELAMYLALAALPGAAAA